MTELLPAEAAAAEARITMLLKEAGSVGLTRGQIRDRLSAKQRMYQDAVYDYLESTRRVDALFEYLHGRPPMKRYIWRTDEPLAKNETEVVAPLLPDRPKPKPKSKPVETLVKGGHRVVKEPVSTEVARTAVYLLIILDHMNGVVLQNEAVLRLRARGCDNEMIRKAHALLRLRTVKADDQVYWRLNFGV